MVTENVIVLLHFKATRITTNYDKVLLKFAIGNHYYKMRQTLLQLTSLQFATGVKDHDVVII